MGYWEEREGGRDGGRDRGGRREGGREGLVRVLCSIIFHQGSMVFFSYLQTSYPTAVL